MTKIFVNDIYRRLNQDNREIPNLFRVLWIDENYTYCYIIDLEGNNAFPIYKEINDLEEEIDNSNIVIDKLYSIHKTNVGENIEDKHNEYNKEVLEILNFLVKGNEPTIYEKSGRSRLVKEAMLKFGITYKTVMKYLRRYLQGGKNEHAIMPHYYNCGAPGKDKEDTPIKRGRPCKVIDGHQRIGMNIDSNTKKVITNSIEKWYKNEKMSLQRTYEMMIGEYFSNKTIINGEKRLITYNKDLIPSVVTFKYWAEKLTDIVDAEIKRKGYVHYQHYHRPETSNTNIEVLGPGSRFQIDATSSDVYVVNEFDRSKIMGKPTLYVIVDVFSREVCGFYLGFEQNSWSGAMMALYNMVEDKREFCIKYGINIKDEDWPCKYISETIIADRGEFDSRMPDNLVKNLNISLEITPPYAAYLKSIVEKTHDLIHQRYKNFVPASIFKEKERQDKDIRLNAKVTLKELTEIVILAILYLNNHRTITDYQLTGDMLKDNLIPTPINLWNWGIKNISGKLKTVPYESMKINLMPSAYATVTQKGIKLGINSGKYYTCDRAERENWFSISSIKKNKIKPKLAYYDKRDMSTIYIYNDQTNEYEVCNLTDACKQYSNLSYFDIEKLNEKQRDLITVGKEMSLEGAVNTDYQISNIVQNATSETDKYISNKSKSKKVAEIRKNTSLEKVKLQNKEAFKLNESTGTQKYSENENSEVIDNSYNNALQIMEEVMEES